MGTAGVQTRELNTEMIRTPHNGHSRCTDPGTQHRDGGSPHNGHSGCTDQGTLHRDGGNPS
ncbi:unnamed protein product [Staurois parvus]|uniref:Uncharacterized protein n=1 Tax=Staurois parvus TaxID=386267 RepID=A0ABN9FVB4_9NEOB|nr:unnamed protein product [Staurois parvus]